ncbi:Aste57867_15832 [Aphanomyces stellatus]|uniref:Aste57867_15832 protein n=1 Tax=Aphanomyces stellatus TaxID=120398 RepID=A0A485L4L5_9STRA|nr:hypothetical protein As57867_015776 [Aphanomyces stellatus]VFT92619.1 Aste57867_15832 [Aphanomyces stellatus]
MFRRLNARLAPQLGGVRRLVHQRAMGYEDLKADFAQWARKEVALVSIFLATGLSVVAVYAYRDDAPVRQITRCVHEATVAAAEGDTIRARQLTQRAYAIASSVSPRERHLHELAFSIGAQYDTAGQPELAKKYYLEALDHIPHIKNAAEKADLVRMITLDRVAQSCHNAGDAVHAARYYEKALEMHVQHKVDTCTPMDAEGCGIWFNYGTSSSSRVRLISLVARLCLDMGQPAKAEALLRMAKRVAIKCDLSDDKRAWIDEQLQTAAAARP